jgi:hypothetical protein
MPHHNPHCHCIPDVNLNPNADWSLDLNVNEPEWIFSRSCTMCHTICLTAISSLALKLDLDPNLNEAE